ncbi:DnaJ domain-containing protein [Microvirga guangxiensis]|uniref:DnaJ domain-containing protein n=2 Tax=Microvirga guangxiensis TaxID=549386 RepID=A0A1G5B9F4_9HYPH|nr:DnaJ domain-containing protein [Microvirga guangxiensis]
MLFYGIVAVVALWLLLSNFTRANPATLAKALKVGGGTVALGIAGLFALRGRIDLALLIGSLGAWLFGWKRFSLPGFRGSAQRTPGNASSVRSRLLEMTLDHDTGAMEGTVLAGAFAGQQLASLDAADLRNLLAECQAEDPDGLRLLEAYLDRRFPEWREEMRNEEQSRTEAQSPSGIMTIDEAYRILNLEPGASTDEIRQAHRTLMKKLHPDQGGSTYLAARVNQAKDILMSHHS